MKSTEIAGIVLAAGKGLRMNSELPKGLHRICDVPMVEMVCRAMKSVGIQIPVVVIGHEGEAVRTALGDGCRYAWQREQLGTGHAVKVAMPLLDGFVGNVLITPGDVPLIDAKTLSSLLTAHEEAKATCTVLSVKLDDPTGYGHIVRDEQGCFVRVVEDKDANAAIRAVKEVSTGVFVFNLDPLRKALPFLSNNNKQREYYLPDAVSQVVKDNGKAFAFVCDDPDAVRGVNDRWQLAAAEKALSARLQKAHALNGVTIIDPNSVMIGPDVKLARDVSVGPHTVLLGRSSVGSRSRVGPFSVLRDVLIGEDCEVKMSAVSESAIGNRVSIGPFANVRPGTVIDDDARIGDFVEVKKSRIRSGAKAPHLAYIGDADVGEGANIGAGTITCNYDGELKHETKIGRGAFVGSNSTLVAPLEIGDSAFIAAGSVITQDVPEGQAGFGRSRQENKPNWAARKGKSEKKAGGD